MVLSAFEWMLIGGAASLAIGLITFFLKRTMSRVETRVDQHETDINHIKLTYVTKKDLEKVEGALEKMEGELKDNIGKLNDSVSEIKEKVLYKDDFYRHVGDINHNIDRLQSYLIEKLGGNSNGK